MSHLTPYVSVSDALARLLAQAAPVAPQVMTVAQARRLILAVPLAAPAALPSQAIALRDGWAVSSDDVAGASGYAPALLARPPLRVLIGDALPVGADAVLPLDSVAMAGGLAEANESAAPGENVRRIGEDAAEGAVLRAAGLPVRALDVAVAGIAGIVTCSVRRPHLRLLGAPADGAAALLAARAERCGGSVEHVALDDAARAEAVLCRPGADLVCVAGGDGALPEALARLGTVTAARLALRPGEGAGCGFVGNTPVAWCSSRPEIALALSLALIEPCLAHLAGAVARESAFAAPLARKISSSLGMAEVALLRNTAAGFEPLATGDLTLAAIADADAWLLVGPDSEGYAAGTTVGAFAL